jgi:Raf kinase inhibitor-like YbhB/YbcL family protein
MRFAYLMTGIGFLVILGGLYFINHRFTPVPHTSPNATVTHNPIDTMNLPDTLTLSSSAFLDGGVIPAAYTCDGQRDQNPPLTIDGVPDETVSLALIVHDPDVPKEIKADGNFDHWVLFNIPSSTGEIESGARIGTPGANGAGNSSYTGPCPPPQYEPSEHRYYFKLYALDTELSLDAGSSRTDVEKAMQGHIVAEAQLVGRYKKK